MADKSTRALAPRKTKSVSLVPNVVASIVFIKPEIRRQQAYKDWNKALRAYVDTLSNDEQTLVSKCLAFIIAKPERREHLHEPCPVMPFTVRNKSESVAGLSHNDDIIPLQFKNDSIGALRETIPNPKEENNAVDILH